MSQEASDLPEFNFPAEAIYNGDTVGDQVVWPLVDALYRAEWRSVTDVGDEFEYPRRGIYLGRFLKAIVTADCTAFELNDKLETHYAAAVAVEEKVDDANKDYHLEAARVALDEMEDVDVEDGFDENEDADEDREDGLVWPDADDSDLIVKRAVAYTFDTLGGWNAEAYRCVEGRAQRLKVPLCESEMENGTIDQLHLRDLENIEAAVYILQAPRALKAVWHAIKARPVEVH